MFCPRVYFCSPHHPPVLFQQSKTFCFRDSFLSLTGFGYLPNLGAFWWIYQAFAQLDRCFIAHLLLYSHFITWIFHCCSQICWSCVLYLWFVRKFKIYYFLTVLAWYPKFSTFLYFKTASVTQLFAQFAINLKASFVNFRYFCH